MSEIPHNVEFPNVREPMLVKDFFALGQEYLDQKIEKWGGDLKFRKLTSEATEQTMAFEDIANLVRPEILDILLTEQQVQFLITTVYELMPSEKMQVQMIVLAVATYLNSLSSRQSPSNNAGSTRSITDETRKEIEKTEITDTSS
jgi:hypothetical protein